jgi:hypothetical protein
MNTTKKTPPIVQIGLWLVSLLVFAIGFWHTHLGLKEFNIFDSEYGSLAVATIVLIFLLTTYWYSINGKKLALVFYIVCGFIFFILNLNYFYPSYMARTLIQSEAKALVDTLDHYSNGTTKIDASENSEAYSDWSKLTSLKSDIISEINSKGFGPNAKSLTGQFNNILSKYNISTVPINPSYGRVTANRQEMESQKNEIEPKLKKAINDFIGYGILKLIDPDLFTKGKDSLENLKAKYKESLIQIGSDNQMEYPLDSIKQNKNVNLIVNFVNELNGSIDQINKGNNKDNPILQSLNEDVHPRADKLGMIKYTLLSIKERINEIDTWAVILFCLFIDLIVPLGIYLLLRKKGDEEESESNLRRKKRPTTF